MSEPRLGMADMARRHFERRDAARRAKRKRLGWRPGARRQRWAASCCDKTLLFFGLATFFLVMVLNADAGAATGFDWGVIGLLALLGSLEVRDGWRGPPMKEGAPPWARERDGDAYVDAWEVEQRRQHPSQEKP